MTVYLNAQVGQELHCLACSFHCLLFLSAQYQDVSTNQLWGMPHCVSCSLIGLASLWLLWGSCSTQRACPVLDRPCCCTRFSLIWLCSGEEPGGDSTLSDPVFRSCQCGIFGYFYYLPPRLVLVCLDAVTYIQISQVCKQSYFFAVLFGPSKNWYTVSGVLCLFLC